MFDVFSSTALTRELKHEKRLTQDPYSFFSLTLIQNFSVEVPGIKEHNFEQTACNIN